MDLSRKRVAGFTLMEVLITTVIVGVIAAAALPAYTTHIERVRSSEGVQILTAVLAAQERFRLENNNTYAANFNNLDITIPNSANFTVPPGVFNNAARVANIVRSDNTYTLCISSTGVLSCSGAAAICAQYPGGGTCP